MTDRKGMEYKKRHLRCHYALFLLRFTLCLTALTDDWIGHTGVFLQSFILTLVLPQDLVKEDFFASQPDF